MNTRAYVAKLTPAGAILSIAAVLILLLGTNAASGQVITGQIVDELTSAPLSGIDLDVFDSNLVRVSGVSATTNGSGNYTLNLPGAGSYVVRADPGPLDGVADEYYNNSFLESGAAAISVGPSQTVNNINFALPRGVLISGRVTSAGVAQANMDIDVYSSSGEFLSGYNATTSVTGDYAIGALPPGSYFVRADANPALGQLLTDTYYPSAGSIAGATAVTVGAVNVSGINISMSAGGTIAGRIVSASGATPIPNIDLDLYTLAGVRVNVNASTDANGDYEIGSMPAGQYILRADPTIAQGFARTYFSSASEFGDAAPIDVFAGQRRTGINFSLVAAATISGTVRQSGTPLSGIRIDCFDASGIQTTFNADTDANGDYTLGPFMPGTYIVMANPTVVQGYADQTYNAQVDLNLGTPIVVPAGAAITLIDFNLALAGQITGTVTNTSAQPVANLDLDLFDVATGSRLAKGARTIANGTYSFESLGAGSYFVRADPTSAQALTLRYFNDKATIDVADPVVVNAGLTTSGINFSLGAGAVISGRITRGDTGDGVGAMDIDVYAYPSLLRVDQNATSLSNGFYSADNLPAGQYILRADPATGQPYFLQYYGQTGDPNLATVITVSAGQTVSGTDIVLTIDESQLPIQPWAVAILCMVLFVATVVVVATRASSSRNPG